MRVQAMSGDDTGNPFDDSGSAHYTYTDADGGNLFQVRRAPGKKFTQHHWAGSRWRLGLNGVKPVLYRLPEVVAAAAAGEEVWVVEGEKDVHSLEKLGMVATTSPGGAGRWKQEFSDSLKGALVRIVADKDEPGYRHALAISESLNGVAGSVTVRRARDGKDVTDHIEAGGNLDQLISVPTAELRKLAGGKARTRPQADRGSADEAREVPAVLRDVLGVCAASGPVGDRGSNGGDWPVTCPLHDDKTPSATVNIGDEVPVVFYCHAGCDQQEFFDYLVEDCEISLAALMGDTNGLIPGGSSWDEVDLAVVLAGDDPGDQPEMLRRGDGVALLYSGKLHSINGEPESGKSWLALLACMQWMADGHHVVYVDFEDSAASVVGRLRTLGVADEVVEEQFHYLRPDEPLKGHEQKLVDLCSFHSVGLVIVDGVTEAMSLHGLSLKDNDDVAKFIKALPRVIQQTGAAVVMIDHVAKSRDERGRWAIGGQHKMAAIDGAVYSMENKQPFIKGAGGMSIVTVRKDRPGGVRPQAQQKVVGRFVLAAKADGTMLAVIQAPTADDVPKSRGDKVADARERIEDLLLNHAFEFTKTDIRDRVKGDQQMFADAWQILEDEGVYTEKKVRSRRSDGKTVSRDVWGPR